MLKIYPRISFIFIILMMTLIIFGVNVKVFAQSTGHPTACGATVKTVCSSGCDYTTIQAAVNASPSTGTRWEIQVKNGTYNEAVTMNGHDGGSATTANCLKAFSGHSPVIDGTGLGQTNGITVSDSFWIIDGFEVREFDAEGIKINNPNNTVQNNYTHHNNQNGSGAGIKVNAGANHTLVTNNRSEFNGIPTGASSGCKNAGIVSPRHCHGIYIGAHTLNVTTSNISIIKNTLKNHAGSGLQINAAGKPAPSNILVENNILENNANGFNFVSIGTAAGRVWRNNTVITSTNAPVPNTTEPSMIDMNGTVRTVKIYNNIFQSTNSDTRAIRSASTNGNNDVDYNLWKMAGNNWRWDNVARTDWSTNYKSVTTWDANGPALNTDPGFVSATDFELDTGSAAIDAGDPVNACPTDDFDGLTRTGTCDLGAFDAGSTTPTVVYEVERAYFVDAANKPCTDTTPADGVCDADDAINKLTEIEKASTEKLCVRWEDSESDTGTIRVAVLDGQTTPEGDLLTNDLVAHIESAQRTAINILLATPNNLGCYATDDSATGAFCGGSATVFGTNGGWDGTHEVYTVTGEADKRWDCFGMSLPDEFNDTPALAEAKIQVVLKRDTSSAISALFEEEGFDVITGGIPPGLPTASLVVKVGSVNNAVNFVRSDSLTFTGTWTGTNETTTYQHCYQAATKQEACPTSGNWTCNASVPVTDTGADNTEDLAVSNFQTGMNRIELRIVDDALQVATDTAFVCLQPTHKLKIGGQGTGAVK